MTKEAKPVRLLVRGSSLPVEEWRRFDEGYRHKKIVLWRGRRCVVVDRFVPLPPPDFSTPAKTAELKNLSRVIDAEQLYDKALVGSVVYCLEYARNRRRRYSGVAFSVDALTRGAAGASKWAGARPAPTNDIALIR